MRRANVASNRIGVLNGDARPVHSPGYRAGTTFKRFRAVEIVRMLCEKVIEPVTTK